MPTLRPLLLLLCLLFIRTAWCLDLCSNFEDEAADSFVHQSATPKGGAGAGVYTRDVAATSLTTCLVSCCESTSCQTLFFHKDTCYLIRCNSTDSCSPVARTEAKFKNSFLVIVRSVGPSQSPLSDVLSHLDVHSECSPDSEGGCLANEVCTFELQETFVGYVCECDQGFTYDAHSNRCTADFVPASCEIGLVGQCPKHERCQGKNKRSRQGVCRCVEGYARDEASGWCENEHLKTREKIKDESTVASTPITSTSKSPPPTSSMLLPSTPPSSTVRPKVQTLVVSAGDNKIVQLPDDQLTLSAYTLPLDDKDEYQYLWSLVSHPDGEETGAMAGMNTANLKLSKLREGEYVFQVIVTAPGKYGEGTVNVTVVPPARQNQHPVAVVKPVQQDVQLPNDVVIDGSGSTDDDKIVSYQWEPATGPLDANALQQSQLDKSMLVLQNLTPGSYTFKLTVTDSDGASNSTSAYVTVVKETDYPPKASVVSPVFVSLPQNSVVLSGNASTDDKGIASYEWSKKSDDQLIADMTGVRTPFLHLQNLQQGDYSFTLKVTDSAGQTSTADVHVIVKQEQNKAPIARAGVERTIWLPASSVTLDGLNSTDDHGITSYLWSQVKGPSSVVIENADRPVATVSGLQVGQYKFRLTITDEQKSQSSDTTLISVKQEQNEIPVANAGGNRVVQLPCTLVALDGSLSTDDKGITSYEWTREDKSLAAGVVVNRTDHRPVMLLTDLVPGRYVFRLTVADAGGLSHDDVASLIVKPEIERLDQVEMHLNAMLSAFTEGSKRNLASELALLLHGQMSEEVHVKISSLRADPSGHVVIIFTASQGGSTTGHLIPGPQVVSLLKKKLSVDSDVLDYRVVLLDTLVCQNNCSGHGHCDQSTKSCVCEAFWMQNFLRQALGGTSNCDWSVLYVIIISFVILVTLAFLVWGAMVLVRRWQRKRPKKRHRYQLLEEDADSLGPSNSLELLPKGKMQNSSLMMSESDFSSDEETLFVNRKANGHVKNGVLKASRNRIKT